ncbi:ABC transporter permease, partial [Streptomyces sp. Agncl-13]|uniref:ABC transporter permease n=1 Tax=Streptomyces sp. Agncl-13 TaxID=3400628 RepID=UPI003A87E9F6
MTSPIDIEGGGTSVVVDGEPGPQAEPEAKKLEGRSPGQLMWIRFKRDRTGVISAYVVAFFFLVGLLAPLISKLYGKDPYTVYADERPELFDSAGVPLQPNGGISSQFWFGLEPGNGYDVFTKLLYGIRTSLMISVCVTIATVVTGILLGVAAGFLGGKSDYFISRVIDFLLAFPAQLFFIASMPVVVSLFVSPTDETPTYVRVVALIAVQWFLGWMSLARILRG